MRILTTLLFLISSHSFSAELLCNMGEYDLSVQTDKQSCESGKASIVKIFKGNKLEASFEASCEFHSSTQYVNNGPVLYKDLFFKMELASTYSDNYLLITNDQRIGFNRGISYLDAGDGSLGKIEFSMIEDCNYGPFMKDFLEIPDNPQAK